MPDDVVMRCGVMPSETVTLERLRGESGSHGEVISGELLRDVELGRPVVIARNGEDRYITSRVLRVLGSEAGCVYVQTRNSVYRVRRGATQPQAVIKSSELLSATRPRRESLGGR